MTKICDKMGFVQATSTPDELARRIEREMRVWGSVIKAPCIKPE